MSVAWQPSDDFLQNSNVSKFMKRHNISDFNELVRKSQDDIEWFWDEVVKFLGIEFFEPYTKVLDSSDGIQWSKWFVGGKINIAHNCVDRHAQKNPDKKALVWEGEDGSTRQITYKELQSETDKIAGALKSLGVGKGDVVGIYLPMIPQAVASCFACMKLGAIYAPIFSGYGRDAIAVRLQSGEAKVLLTADGFFHKGKKIEMKRLADEAVSSSPSVKNVIVFKNTGDQVPMTENRDFFADDDSLNTNKKIETLKLDSEDPFMLIYTSGTTGKPKGAVHVHGGFLTKITQEVAFQTDVRENDTLYWITDMGWIMAPWEIIGVLSLGATLFIYDGGIDYPNNSRIWEIIQRHKISVLGLSPTAIRHLMKFGTEPLESCDLTSLRVIASTGEPWNPDPWMWCFDHVGGKRCPIVNLSGGTEVGACFLSVHPVIPLKPCTLGGPALGMAIDVFDDSGSPVREKIGELVCTKPWPGMTRGVWNDPERFISAYWYKWPNVWVHGDLASIDSDGMWFLHGRSDDTIMVAGRRIGPAELESAMVSHQDVVEAVAIGVPHDVKGEAAICFVVLNSRQGNDELESELKEIAAQMMGRAMRPDKVYFVNQLPKTRNAKIMRRLVKKKYLGQDLGDTSTLENPGALDGIPTA